MIKGLILDVDGVLVGGKKGYNWPLPNPQIIKTLQKLRQRGIVVSLCTGKATFAIREIVTLAHLDNVHIGDGGALVVDIINNSIIEQHTIDIEKITAVLNTLLPHTIYTELYTQSEYYAQKNQTGIKTDRHKAILYKEPVVVESLLQKAKDLAVVKIMPVADDEKQKDAIINLMSTFKDTLSLQWAIHPSALPYQFGVITVKGVSKKQAAMTISKHTGVPLQQMLGVGDGMIDWDFIKICGYGGAMGNASQELKDKVASKNETGFIGTSIDENGLLDILNHFGLTDGAFDSE